MVMTIARHEARAVTGTRGEGHQTGIRSEGARIETKRIEIREGINNDGPQTETKSDELRAGIRDEDLRMDIKSEEVRTGTKGEETRTIIKNEEPRIDRDRLFVWNAYRPTPPFPKLHHFSVNTVLFSLVVSVST